MIEDPTNSPDYEHPLRERIEPALHIIRDVWDGLYLKKENYLPRAESEPNSAYQERVDSAFFNNKLRPTIESNVGLLSAFELSNLPTTVELALDNIDGSGSDFRAFFAIADRLALRDRCCYIWVDSPKISGNRTLADQRSAQSRPVLRLIERLNFRNWRTYTDSSGRRVLDRCSIALTEEIPQGEFGVKCQRVFDTFVAIPNRGVQYRRWRPNSEGVLIAGEALFSPLPKIPIIPYPDCSEIYPEDMPAFFDLAQLNLKLFRQESNLGDILYRVNVPTPYRKSEIPLEQRSPVIFGGSYVLELDSEDSVGFLEIQGAGIRELREAIANTKIEIEAESSAFVSGARVTRTATESYLSAAQVTASLNGYARLKSSAIQEVFSTWCNYTGEENNTEVQMDNTVLSQPSNAQDVGVLLQINQAGKISHKTFLELLVLGKKLPPGFDVEEELNRIKIEFEEQTAIAPPNRYLDNQDALPTDGQNTSDQVPSLQSAQ